uniref:Uncharacterized protein n=1 Tax=Anopheles arabiensis TaxID=7173 RepID=A0A182IFT7_ANOAR
LFCLREKFGISSLRCIATAAVNYKILQHSRFSGSRRHFPGCDLSSKHTLCQKGLCKEHQSSLCATNG